jgi:tyrosyl-tRNA synthetase
MMAKDSVQKRLETGMSFTEFTYQLIQGYDFFHLNQHHGVKLQMGGADQWGNITTGTEMIRKKGGGDAFAFTCKLVTKADGSKFGKSEGGNVWLDREKTSPYQFYQFWLNLPDTDAARMALIFSFRPVGELKEMIAAHEANPGARALQKALAEEMTLLVHGEEDVIAAKRATELLFGQASIETLQALNERQLLEAMEGVKQVTGTMADLEAGVELLGFLAEKGVLPSKGEARKMVQAGAIGINKQKVTDIAFKITNANLLNGRYVLIQKGKKEYTLAIFE